ncbi:hypothetical protein, partial [Glycomyces tenuis]|uniref:hypothetical protein n=1 Tax=Glycomyces tenuis TaxID=58116 RepID=UPI00054EC83E
MDPFPARGAARRGGPEQWRRARASLVVLIPVAVALWALAGYASVSFLDTFRLMAVNDIGGWGEGTAGLAGGIMLFVGAVFAASFLGFAVGRRSTAAFATFKAGGLLSRAAAFGGVTVGLLVAWASDRWTRPTAVGRFVSEQDGDSDWGAPAWAAYHAPWLLPLG